MMTAALMPLTTDMVINSAICGCSRGSPPKKLVYRIFPLEEDVKGATELVRVDPAYVTGSYFHMRKIAGNHISHYSNR